MPSSKATIRSFCMFFCVSKTEKDKCSGRGRTCDQLWVETELRRHQLIMIIYARERLGRVVRLRGWEVLIYCMYSWWLMEYNTCVWMTQCEMTVLSIKHAWRPRLTSSNTLPESRPLLIFYHQTTKHNRIGSNQWRAIERERDLEAAVEFIQWLGFWCERILEWTGHIGWEAGNKLYMYKYPHQVTSHHDLTFDPRLVAKWAEAVISAIIGDMAS